MELRGYVQTFPWGKKGEQSLVGVLHWNTKKIRKLKETADTRYTELWIGGTLGKGVTIIRKTKERLSDYVRRHQELLGISRYLFKTVPFVLKVISVARPTPIRTHLEERHAAILHKELPQMYPDTLHKPKILVALTRFRVMAGIRPKKELIYFMKNVPELTIVISPSIIDNYIKNPKEFYLRKVIECFLNAKEEKITEAIEKYFERMEAQDSDTQNAQLFDIIQELQEICPNDIGVLWPFFSNYFTLEPKEAIYIPSSMPYSYLDGDAVECTTCSFNEIRIGITSGYKDITAFIEYGDLASYVVEELKVKPTPENYQFVYDCDEDEFVVSKVTVNENSFHNIYGKRSFCIFIVIEGSGLSHESEKIKAGTVILVPACHSYEFLALENMIIFMAEPNLVI